MVFATKDFLLHFLEFQDGYERVRVHIFCEKIVTMMDAPSLLVREYEEEPSLAKDGRGRVHYSDYHLVRTDDGVSVRRISSRRVANSITNIAADIFLPVGYPHSVAPLYLQYQIYDSLQGLSSYLRGVGSTTAVLQAVGVGDARATALSAAITWALRDGIAMIGGLVFSYAAAPSYDAYVKEFRLFADVINDVGLALDMIAPLFQQQYILYVTSAATLCKTMCGMAAGATKPMISKHFAIAGNMADLNAKESTQETLVNIIGMILGVLLAKQIQAIDQKHEHTSDQPSPGTIYSWIVFVVLTVVHVWANYVGVRLL